MISKNKYYYLVAGLPELLLTMESDQKSSSFSQLFEEVKEHLKPRDFSAVRELFMVNDFFNLIYLLQEVDYFNEKSTYPKEYWLEMLENRENMPLTIQALIKKVNQLTQGIEDEDEEDRDPDIEIIERIDLNQLVWEFFLHEVVEKSQSPFIREWFAFEQLLRNIQSAFAAREAKLAVRTQLIGNEEQITPLLSSNSSDFGLRREIEMGEEIFQTLENDQLMEREFNFDQIRWKKAEELAMGHEFEQADILAFLVKADLVDRWFQLNKEKGSELFNALINDLKKMPEAADAADDEIEK